MQAPVGHAGNDRLTRQLGTVHKEQQRDGGIGQAIKGDSSLPVHGKQAGGNDDSNKAEGHVVR